MIQTDASPQQNEIRDLNTWLEKLGFRSKPHPFEQVVADTDENIGEYFSQFPFFEQIGEPKCTFLFLERGTGKSANRIMLKRDCDESLERRRKQRLGVEYTDFYKLISEGNVSLAGHVEAILRAAVPRLFEVAIRKKSRKKDLPEEYQKDFVWFIKRYSERLNRYLVKQEARDIDGLSEESRHKLREVLIKDIGHAIGLIGTVVEIASPLGKAILDIASTFSRIDSKDVENLENIYHSPLDLMARFAEIAGALDIEHIYILVDRVDEYAQVYDYQRAADMLKPLIEAIPLLEMSPYAFKFFLPLEIKDKLAKHLRSDRFDVYEPKWEKDDLRRLLASRIKFSYADDPPPIDSYPESELENFISVFESLFEDQVRTREPGIIDEMIDFANGSPRNLLKLAKMIFDEHTQSQSIESLIPLKTYERALGNFADEQIQWRTLDKNEAPLKQLGQLDLSDRLTLSDLVKDLVKNYLGITHVDKAKTNNLPQVIRMWESQHKFFAPHFGLTDVIQFLNKPKNEAREIANEWEARGLVSIHYKIEDPSLVRYLYAKRKRNKDGHGMKEETDDS